MTSTVQLRKPRKSSSLAPSTGRIGRPKSWTEFNTRFQAFSAPINIDLAPVPKVDDEVLKRRESNSYRKVRPLSASLLEQPDDGSLRIKNRPSSPKYRSFMTPNPWRNSGMKLGKAEVSQTQKPANQTQEMKINYDATTDNYDEIKNVTDSKMTSYELPQANAKSGFTSKIDGNGHFKAKVRELEASSDSDSIDSAVVVSGGSTPHGTSSEKSPKWRYNSNRAFDSEESTPTEVKSTPERPRTLETKKGGSRRQNSGRKNEKVIRSPERYPENTKISGYQSSTATVTLSPPQVIVTSSKEVRKMEFFPDEDIIRFAESPTGNYVGRTIVPSPLKSCYSSAATYDALVEISDFENSSGEENSISELSRSNISRNKGYEADRSADEYKSRTTPMALPRQASLRGAKPDVENSDDVEYSDVRKQRYDVRSGTWPRRKVRKREDAVDVEQLMEEFKKARDIHLTKFKNIYEDSRKRINEVLASLKTTMTGNGYREWFPKVRVDYEPGSRGCEC